jgi:hypothetical protein
MVGLAARMKETGNVYMILFRISQRKTQRGRIEL